eukprot:343660-Chlamydomonas_euryale.AAC.3
MAAYSLFDNERMVVYEGSEGRLGGQTGRSYSMLLYDMQPSLLLRAPDPVGAANAPSSPWRLSLPLSLTQPVHPHTLCAVASECS